MSVLTHCPRCGVALRPTPKPLTQQQARVLAFVREFINEHEYPPSFKEIAANCGYHSLSTVHEHLRNLERKGHITRSFNEARGIALIGSDSAVTS
jgi:repressor LexA